MKRLDKLEKILILIFIALLIGTISCGNFLGVDGLAIALGIISAAALVLIVWIEIFRVKNGENK